MAQPQAVPKREIGGRIAEHREAGVIIARAGRPRAAGIEGKPVRKGIYRYILRHSARQQVVLTLMAVASFPFLYAFYELPKQIVNEAILANTLAFPVALAGVELGQIAYLFLLSALFLLLVFFNQSFKYAINVYRGRVGERMLRRLRFDLYSRVLRFPLPTFRKTSQGEVIQMITAEVEPLGGFVGDAFSLPAFQGGTLLVILSFLLVQNPYMALAATALYPLQFWLIPKLQRRVNALGKERVRLVRRLSDRIGESIAGVQEIHANDTSALHLAQFSHRLGEIYTVRLRIFIWKFIIKFLNNSINQLGPFCFYSIGGYLVIDGNLEIGTLLAAIAAHKDLAAPWKELLTYYQRREDARIKFGQVIEQFEPAGMLDGDLQRAEPASVAPLSGDVVGTNVVLEDDTGTVLIDGASFRLDPTRHVAVVGSGGSGKEDLMQVLARLIAASSGTITIGEDRLAQLPEAVTGRRLGYVGAQPYLFAASVHDNLVYGLKHRPLRPAQYDDAGRAELRARVHEAEASGNSVDDPYADWIDYRAADAEGGEELGRRIFEALDVVGLAEDIYEMGLRGTIDPAAREDLARRLLDARAAFRDRLADPEIAALVETFDPRAYNENATVGENLLFGTPVGDAFQINRLAENSYVLQILEESDLTGPLLEAGREVAALMVELFADLPSGHQFFEQNSFISSDDLPAFQAIIARIGREGIQALRSEERAMLLSLPFMVSAARHRLDAITPEIKDGVLRARKRFADKLPEHLAGAVEFFDPARFNAAATLQDNILFGKLAHGQARGAERVGALIGEVIDALDLRSAVMAVGLEFQVGIGGSRLSGIQRQRIGLARTLLKKPDILLLNEAGAAFDAPSLVRLIGRVLEAFRGRGVIWALSRPDLAANFEEVMVVRGGRVVEHGPVADLDKDGSAFRDLLSAG